MQVLKDTSRTFYIPITLLETTLKQTVASAYLCMRAIDEIEDDHVMDGETKQSLLLETSELLKKEPLDKSAFDKLVAQYKCDVPQVMFILRKTWMTIRIISLDSSVSCCLMFGNGVMGHKPIEILPLAMAGACKPSISSAIRMKTLSAG